MDINNIGLIAMIATAAFCLGILAHYEYRIARRNRDPLSVDGLAERADVNGSELVSIARHMDRAAAASPDTLAAAELRAWSVALKRIAVDHLACINAISLDSLERVQGGPVHLGQWSGGVGAAAGRAPLRPGSNPPAPAQLRKPPPPPAPPAAREVHRG